MIGQDPGIEALQGIIQEIGIQITEVGVETEDTGLEQIHETEGTEHSPDLASNVSTNMDQVKML